MSTAVARTREESIALAKEASARLEGQTADKIVEWAAGEFGDRFCVTSSFADAVLAHVVSKVVPGVPAFAGAAASLATELTLPDVSQTVILTRVSSGASPMPESESLEVLARSKATLALHLAIKSAARIAETLIPLVAIGLPLSPIAAGAAAPLFNAPPVFTVGGEGQEMNNLHTMLTAPQFLIFSLIGVLLAGLVAYPLVVRYARQAALFVARRLSHEAVIGAFAGLVLVVTMYEGGIYGVIVMLTVGLVGGVLNRVIGMHVGVQCMAYYVSVLSVPVLLG